MIRLGDLVSRILPTGSQPRADNTSEEALQEHSAGTLLDSSEHQIPSQQNQNGSQQISSQQISLHQNGSFQHSAGTLLDSSEHHQIPSQQKQNGSQQISSQQISLQQNRSFESQSVVEASIVTEPSVLSETMVNTRSAARNQQNVVQRMPKRRRRGMEKMIIVGTRVSSKCGELIPNPRGSQFRRVRQRIYGNVVASIGDNKYSVQFDNGLTKQLVSNSLRIEDSTAAIPPSEASQAGTTITEKESVGNPTGSLAVEDREEHINDTQDQIDEEEHIPNITVEEEDNDDDVNEEDDGMNEDSVNIGDINVPADTPEEVPLAEDGVRTPLTYHNKLQAKRDEVNDLLGTTVVRSQQNKSIEWKVVEESVPTPSPDVSEYRDNLSNKFGLNHLLEFLNEFGYEMDSSQESCSLSFTSSNCNLQVKSLQESTIFAELFLKLMYKDWDAKLVKMNRYIEEQNTSTPKRTIKKFERWDFIIGHALLIGASCYCQSGSALFMSSKERNEDMWDTVIQNARFDQYMKLYRFKEFRHFLPKIFELPLEKDHDPWWRFASAISDFNDIRKNNIISSWVKVLDETMSAWRPRTSKNGGLPNISYIIRKPEPLGTEFKTVCCPATGVMTYMEIQRGMYKIYFIKH